MQLTILSNSKGKMCKTYEKDLTKDGVSQLYQGKYKVISISSLEQIGSIKKKLKSNQAIILGTPINSPEEGDIFSRNNYRGSGITRTKDMFENKSGLICFDYDGLEHIGDITLEQFRDMLIKCDSQLKHVEMFLTYASSSGITNGKEHKGWRSIHAYCRIDKEMYIKSYGESLLNNGLNHGYGEIKINETVFKGYINGIIDISLLKGDPSRIIYEAAPILNHKKLKRETKPDLYFAGKAIQGSQIDKTKINVIFQNKVNTIIENLKKKYKSTSKDSKDVKRRNIERTNQIYGSDYIFLNNGKKVKARKVLIGKHIEEDMRDPFEPEKGPNKAKIFETEDYTKRPTMHSFLHGGQMYYFHADLESLPYLVEHLEEEDIYTIVKRDFKGYMQDKAVAVIADVMDKTASKIRKYIKESDYSKQKDLLCSEEGLSNEEEIATEQQKAWEQLSENTFYILEGKNPLYIEIDDDGSLQYNTPLKLRETYKEFNTKDNDFITEWIEGGFRKKIKGVRFDPKQEPSSVMSNGYYNLWKGFSCSAAEGDVQPFLDFTKDIIVGNDPELFEFLIDYLAHIVQYPDKKEGMACVLKGSKGVGKDTWIGAFASLFDRSHYLAVNSMKTITGNFNIHLQHSIICNLGEAFFSGDHAAEGALKTLITEKEMQYEPKHMDSFSGSNYTRVFMSTNLDWVVPAKGNDERRYIVLEVSDLRRGDLDYMDKFRIWLNNGGREALLHYLMEREITHTMYKAPETKALVEQKEHGLHGIEKWIYDCAMRNDLLGANSFSSKEFFDVEIKAGELFDSYKEYSKDKYIGTAAALSRKINELCDPIKPGEIEGDGRRSFKEFKKKRFIKAFKNKTGIEIRKEDLGSL